LDSHRRLPQEQPGGLELRSVIGDLEPQRLEIGEPPAELLALAHIFDGAVEHELRSADRTGADVQPSALKPGHRHLEADAFRADAVLSGYAALLKNDHRRRLGVPAELPLLLAEGKPGRALLDYDAGDSRRPRPAGAHHADVDLRFAGAGDECL